jgi:hypothetical protein
MISGVATVAKQKYVFLLSRVTNGAWIALFWLFFCILAQPLLNIELGDLFLVFDFVLGNGGSWQRVNVSEGIVEEGR